MLEVILTQDVEKLGLAGDLVRVRPGFGRNYLLPRGLALTATRGNKQLVEHHKRAIAAEQARKRAEHERMANSLRDTSVSIARKVGQEGKLFGAVTSRDIVEALAAQHVVVDRKLLHLPEPIRSVGTHEVSVRFSAEVSVSLRVDVVGI